MSNKVVAYKVGVSRLSERVLKIASRRQVKRFHHLFIPETFSRTNLDYLPNLLGSSIVNCDMEGRLLVMAQRIRVCTIAKV